MSDALRPDETRDALRKLGGLLLGLGFLLWLIRKGGDMSDFVQFVLLAIPGAFLYGAGVLTQRETGGLRPWQAVYSVFGLVFIPLALFTFIDLINGSPGDGLNVFWVFGVTAALAYYAGLVAGVRFQLLLGSIAVIVAWSGLWDKILSGGISDNFGAYRGLLGLLAIGLLAAAIHVWRTNPGGDAGAATATDVGGDRGLAKASELFTGAGIAAVIACGLGIAQLFVPQALGLFLDPGLPGTSVLWDALLLVVSLGLVAIGAQVGLRGPAYVGAVGLGLFLVLVGSNVAGDPPEPDKFGVWPAVLLVLGALAIALSAVKEASQGDKPRQLVSRLRGR